MSHESWTTKKLLNQIADDNMEVVVSGYDHSYSKVGQATSVVKAEMSRRNGSFGQYYDDDNMSDTNNSVVDVFWIDDGRY